MNIIQFGDITKKLGCVKIKKNHFFFSIFKDEKEQKTFFIRGRSRFFDVLVLEHPFDVEMLMLFEISMIKIKVAVGGKISLGLHLPKDRIFFSNNQGGEMVSVLQVE